jgi:urease accessory protein UreF
MLTREQVEEGRMWFAASVAGGAGRIDADQQLTLWFHQHAEALLEAAERVIELSGLCECQGGPFVTVGCPLCVDKEEPC